MLVYILAPLVRIGTTLMTVQLAPALPSVIKYSVNHV